MNFKTQGIRYTGSKKNIIPKIYDIICNLDIQTVLDGFSGTTRVSQFFKKNGYSVVSNDIAEYSKVFGYTYLLNNKDKSYYLDKIEYLNSLKGVKGFYTENYGGTDNNGLSIQSDGTKRIWQIHNTMKLDAIRNEIDVIAEDEIEKSVLITSLILALDKVDNTLGHQIAFLKKWSNRSYNIMKLEIPDLIINNKDCDVIKGNVFDINRKFDLCYFDPPYGTNNKITKTTRVRYTSYYNIWNTICLNDNPKLIGKSKRREDASSDRIPGAVSDFENTKDSIVEEAFKKLFEIESRYYLFSYNNKSKLSIDKLIDILKDNSIILKLLSFKHKENVQSSLITNGKWKKQDKNKNLEFLILCANKNSSDIDLKIDNIKYNKFF